MARRYSGLITIYVNWYPSSEKYRCSVVTPEGRRQIIVGLSPEQVWRVEDGELSPIRSYMLHNTARAALSFSIDEDERRIPAVPKDLDHISTAEYMEIDRTGEPVVHCRKCDAQGRFIVTSYCCQPHELATGKPIDHKCRVLPPEALAAERNGEYVKAMDLIAAATTSSNSEG